VTAAQDGVRRLTSATPGAAEDPNVSPLPLPSSDSGEAMDWKIELIPVPVTDVERAKRFYGELLGFIVDLDHQANERTRLVQLTPPGSACSIMLGTGIVDSEPGSLKGIQIVVSDIEAGRAELVGRGVDVGPVRHLDENGAWVDGKGGPWNSFMMFNDPDGNGWVVQEKPADG
jgi:catechol 2,3-dioxygenase-like lactoylglutathione lyase family enzyme